MADRSELKRAFKESKPPMGVFVIRNTRNGRFLVRAALNLQAGMNRLKVEITPSTNPNADLLEDWRSMGREAFEIRVLDVLEPRDAAGWDPAGDLAELEALWRSRLEAEGGRPY